MMKNMLSAAFALATLWTACAQRPDWIAAGDENRPDSISYVSGLTTGYRITGMVGALPISPDAYVEGLEGFLSDEATISRETAIALISEFSANGMPDSFANGVERYTISYALGVIMGGSLAENRPPYDLQLVWYGKGFKESFEGSAAMSPEEAQKYLFDYITEVVPAKNKAESEAWLAETARQRGVKKSTSGLLYRITEAGDRNLKVRNDNDRVLVHYTGWDRFDRRFDGTNREPLEFVVGNVIAGWAEGLKLVGKGGRITLWIPAESAYGEKGAGGVIQPNSALKFEIEVVDVKPHEKE